MKTISLILGVILLLVGVVPVAAQVDFETHCTTYTLTTLEPEPEDECILWLKGVNEDGDYLVQIIGKNLSGGQFSGMMLNERDLMGANLVGADLSNAYIDFSALNDANLTGANLSGAVLLGADLTGADLTDADLTNALITCATLPNGEIATAEAAAELGAVIDDFDCSQIISEDDAED